MREMTLAGELARYESVLVAYSGGVDSALVAVMARRVLGRDRSAAAIGVSPSLSEAQHQQARAVARQFDVRLVEIPTNELTDTDYRRNTPSRCYFCKRELWEKLTAYAQANGFAAVADGTNADDLGEHRPGLRASAEWGVRSPLADAGYDKARIRVEARALGIPIWDAPAAPCLASRIRYGVEVTRERLAQVERAEAILRAHGLAGDFRVRHAGSEARIEVSDGERHLVSGRADTIGSAVLALGFDRVTLDLAGYRRGSQLEGGAPQVEVLAERA